MIIGPSRTATEQKDNQTQPTTPNKNSSLDIPKATILREISPGLSRFKVDWSTSTLSVIMSGLHSALNTSDIELLVSKAEVSLSVPSKYIQPDKIEVVKQDGKLRLSLQGNMFQFCENDVKASFKKKKGTLSIEVKYVVSNL